MSYTNSGLTINLFIQWIFFIHYSRCSERNIYVNQKLQGSEYASLAIFQSYSQSRIVYDLQRQLNLFDQNDSWPICGSLPLHHNSSQITEEDHVNYKSLINVISDTLTNVSRPLFFPSLQCPTLIRLYSPIPAHRRTNMISPKLLRGITCTGQCCGSGVGCAVQSTLTVRKTSQINLRPGGEILILANHLPYPCGRHCCRPPSTQCIELPP